MHVSIMVYLQTGWLSVVNNGITIQFYSHVSGVNKTYTLPISYGVGNYAIVAALISSNNDTVRSWHAWTYDKTITTFKFMDITSATRQIITIGY